MELLTELTIILLFSFILKIIFNRFNWPIIIGQLLLGIILGPALLNWIKPSNMLSDLSEIGVILLMFLAGLDTDLNLLKKNATASSLVAVFGVLLPMITIYPLGLAFDFSSTHSIFLAVIFAATSVSITVEVLRELNYLQTHAGVVIMGAAVIDDFIAIALLSVVDAGHNGGSMPLWQMIIAWIIFGLVLWLVGHFLIKYLDFFVSKIQLPYKEPIVALLLAFLAALTANYVQLDAVLGAFLMGVILGQTKIKQTIDVNISSLANLIFIPVFFLSIGLPVTFKYFNRDFGLVIALSLVAIFTKYFGAVIGARLSKINKADARIIGSGMISRGEMALIIAQLGYQQHLIAPINYTAIILAIVISTIAAPVCIKLAINAKEKQKNRV